MIAFKDQSKRNRRKSEMNRRYRLELFASMLVVALTAPPFASYGKPVEAPSEESPAVDAGAGQSIETNRVTASGDQLIAPEPEAPAPSSDDISTLLSLLSISEERKQFAAGLEALLRQGKVEAAERQVNTAIDIGTLALILADHVHDPQLLQQLQAYGISGPDQPLSPSLGSGSVQDKSAEIAVCNFVGGSPSMNASELQEALEQERERGDAFRRQLKAALEEAGNHRACYDRDAVSPAAKVIELQNALEQQQELNRSTTQRLALVEEDLRKLETLHEQRENQAASKIVELQGTVEREKDKAARGELAIRAEFRDLQALHEEGRKSAASTIAELQGSLLREKEEGAQREERLRDLQSRWESNASRPNTTLRFNINGVQNPTIGDNESLPLLIGQPASLVGMATSLLDVKPMVSNVPDAPAPEASAPVEAAPTRQGEQRRDVRPSNSQIVETASLSSPGALSAGDRLLVRADALFRRGDVNSARLLLERALQRGNPRAAFLLAETFDAHVLSQVGVHGIHGDAEQARKLYTKALLLGNKEAAERIEALK